MLELDPHHVRLGANPANKQEAIQLVGQLPGYDDGLRVVENGNGTGVGGKAKTQSQAYLRRSQRDPG